MKCYCVYAPPYTISSAGIIVMHRLAHELAERGMDVFMNTDRQNPKYPFLPLAHQWCHRQREEKIAIYPEIVHGDPFYAGTVVRYILNVPGRCCNGPTSFPSSDLLYAYSFVWIKESGLPIPMDNIYLFPR